MSLADELLDTVAGGDISLYMTDPATEPHIVVNSDRTVVVPEEFKKLAVQFDHNVETIMFDCPRYWDGHDMSEMNVYINYIRADNQTGSYSTEITGTDESTMYFSWTISNHVTAVKGEIAFLVCVKKTEGEEEVNHWNSELCRECYISEGLEAEVVVANDNVDVIDRMYNMILSIDPDAGGDASIGQDGFSPIANVRQTSTGAVITITDKTGTTTATIRNGEDGKDGVVGKDGVDGKTPVKGVDYYTESDKQEMVEAVLAALPNGDEVSY